MPLCDGIFQAFREAESEMNGVFAVGKGIVKKRVKVVFQED